MWLAPHFGAPAEHHSLPLLSQQHQCHLFHVQSKDGHFFAHTLHVAMIFNADAIRDLEAFQHMDLEDASSQIRLLRIHSTGPSYGDDIPHFVLVTVSRTSAPYYIALSYTWGEVLPRRHITAAGMRFVNCIAGRRIRCTGST